MGRKKGKVEKSKVGSIFQILTETIVSELISGR